MRVIVDVLMIDAEHDTLLALAAHANVHIRIYNPQYSVGTSMLQRLGNLVKDFRAVNQRMHDKTCPRRVRNSRSNWCLKKSVAV